MKIDVGLDSNLKKVGAQAEEFEALGYDGLLTFETSSDPFLPLTVAADHTKDIDLMTSIAVAFARTPMTLAGVAHDLNAFSDGRFTLGLGSQIRPHITKRYSMPWSRPAARMKELIQAMHAIFDCWYDGQDLNFRGEFYKHTLMTPMFAPRNTQNGRPKIALAAVGPKMTEVAAAVADGLIIHPFTTERYLRDVTIPAVEAELARSGRSRQDFQFYMPHMTSSGATEESFNKVKKAIRNQLAFYGSTPAYKVVLDHHGWGDLQPELNIMSKQGRWDDMGALINDEILDTFSVAGEPDQIAGKINERFGDIIDRFSVTFADIPADKLPGIIAEIKAA